DVRAACEDISAPGDCLSGEGGTWSRHCSAASQEIVTHLYRPVSYSRRDIGAKDTRQFYSTVDVQDPSALLDYVTERALTGGVLQYCLHERRGKTRVLL